MWKNLIIIILIAGYLLYLSPYGKNVGNIAIDQFNKYSNPSPMDVIPLIDKSILEGKYHFKPVMEYNIDQLQNEYDEIEKEYPYFRLKKMKNKDNGEYNIQIVPVDNDEAVGTFTIYYDSVKHHLYDLPGKLKVTGYSFKKKKVLEKE